jgi:hypothetical protein
MLCAAAAATLLQIYRWQESPPIVSLLCCLCLLLQELEAPCSATWLAPKRSRPKPRLQPCVLGVHSCAEPNSSVDRRWTKQTFGAQCALALRVRRVPQPKFEPGCVQCYVRSMSCLDSLQPRSDPAANLLEAISSTKH